jgi:hypothetical protein
MNIPNGAQLYLMEGRCSPPPPAGPANDSPHQDTIQGNPTGVGRLVVVVVVVDT